MPDFIDYTLLGHLSFFLTAVSFGLRDMLLLRLLAVVSGLIGVIYNYMAGPLWIAMFWLSVFSVINLTRIVLLVWERRQIDLSAEESEIFNTQFSNMTPVEFRKLTQIAEWKTFKPNEHLAKQGEVLDKLMLIYNGEVHVERNGEQIATCRDGALIGEVSFLHKGTATADVEANTKTKVLAWESEALRSLLFRNPSMNIAMQSVFSADLTKKLMN